MKLHLLILCVAVALLAPGCADVPSSAPPQYVTDTTPLGEGLKTLAYAFLGASVVITLGRLLR